MLKLADLHVYYGGIHALKGVSINVPEGQIVTLIGANGAGKSSTLRAISGLIKNIKGQMTYKNQSIVHKDPVDIVKSGISMSPEGRKIFPHLSVLENLKLGAYSRNDTRQIQTDIQWVFELFPRLRERQDQKGGTLSGGEQQMLALGRALMSAPDLIMLDEPSLGLAPLLVNEVFNIIQTINQNGKTVLLVEQNAYAALKIAHYAYVMEVGAIVLEGEGKHLLADKRVCEAYLGG
jgi:branched-chain amino acid transport system ATP-binding protein